MIWILYYESMFTQMTNDANFDLQDIDGPIVATLRKLLEFLDSYGNLIWWTDEIKGIFLAYFWGPAVSLLQWAQLYKLLATELHIELLILFSLYCFHKLEQSNVASFNCGLHAWAQSVSTV